MVQATCQSCGSETHWEWEEAFDKFGFSDGDGHIHTWRVKIALEKAGYEIHDEPWGFHNIVITSIKKGNVEFIPVGNKSYTFGVDNPRAFFPKKLIALLDREFPTTT